ncbi:MAG: AAA family ATPase [Hyphomicrobium sp.]|uniref:AAA family ATPase n=1 Tax=Hyphomicrobium sp. TaxID=82 RepID=UPI003D0D2513
MMLKEIKYIQNVGRFQTAKPSSTHSLTRCVLIFGENGWGKSTLADVLRSLDSGDPAILKGRITLPAGTLQKIVIRCESGACVFDDGAWKGNAPRIAVYDSSFINDNVFSGDSVSADHMKNQYGLVVGEEGVKRVKKLVALDDENRQNNEKIRTLEAQLGVIVRSVAPAGMTPDAFLGLPASSTIDQDIAAKGAEAETARRAKELIAAPVPEHLPVPTDPEQFTRLLETDVKGVSIEAARAVRDHISHHTKGATPGGLTHEGWIESGVAFETGDDCPFCGQELADRTLVDAYAEFFGEAYKNLAGQVVRARETFARYASGDFRRAFVRQMERNEQTIKYWTEASSVPPADLKSPVSVPDVMEAGARGLDAVFVEKQSNLTASLDPNTAAQALQDWTSGREAVIALNAVIDEYVRAVAALKGSLDQSKLASLEAQLKTLTATKRRHETDVVELAKQLEACKARKEAIATEKEQVRADLTAYGKKITDTLGKMINEYLGHLQAGFSIDYQPPNYQGKEPAASYSILINDHPVSPRADAVDKPSFRNTLSSGDKSTLALAFFLARVKSDPLLADTIVVLDDPFTSLDGARRQFTANEIRKLCAAAKQVVVLSHEKSFLRLLWDKIDHSIVTSIALQTGAPGMTTIAPFDIEASTQPRHITERTQIQEYLDGEEHDPRYIRTRLRTVCEDFYRKGDPGLFKEAASLEEIVRRLDAAPADYVYKPALDNLREINEYSRADSHAKVDGNAAEETTTEELKGFCRMVIALTRGL